MKRIVYSLVGFILAMALAAPASASVPLAFDPATSHNLAIAQQDGISKLTITGADPYIEFEKKSFEAHKSDAVRIKYRSKQAYTSEIYWATPVSPYGAANTMSFPLGSTEVPGTGALEWATTDVPVGLLSSQWTGTIVGVRFDPSYDLDCGEIEIESISIVSIPSVKPTRPAPAREGEYVGEVLTAIEPSSGSRSIGNSQYRISTKDANLLLSKPGTDVPIADISFDFEKSPTTAAFSTKDFPKDNLFCRFQDKWESQALWVFYQSPGAKPEQTIDAWIKISMSPKGLPAFEISGPGKAVISPTKDAKGLVLPDANKVVIGDQSSRNSHFSLAQPRSVTLKPGIVVIDGTVGVSSGKKAPPRKAAVGFSTVISSDYMDVNFPIGVNEARVELPAETKVTRVTDAMTGATIPYTLRDGSVVLHRVTPRIVRIKCDRLLDYRVMLSSPRPIDGGRFYEDFSNYYYPQWMFLWEGYLDKDGKTKLDALDWLDGLMKTRPLPVFVGLHYGNHAPKGSYDTFHKLHPDILQIDNHGNPHKGLGGAWVSPPWMCLVHPTLREELSERLGPIFDTIKAKPYYNRVFGFGSTSEPWIASYDNDPETIFCYNPEHIKWFRRFERDKWADDLYRFNTTFGTGYKSWDEVEPPRKVEKTAYYNEWQLSKFQAVTASEEFFRGEMFLHATDRPNYAHSAIMVIYNQIKNSDTPDIMHVGKYTNPTMFREGGSLYCNEPMGQAFVADSIRAFDTDEACFPEMYSTRYGEMYSYLVGESGLFKKSFNQMIPGLSWDTGVQVGSAWPVFSEIMRFLCLDLGEVARPEIGMLYDPLSDNTEAMRAAHAALFMRNIDRCVITSRMIERGYLTDHPLRTLILPGVKMLSEDVLGEIVTAIRHGLKVVVTGEFATSDYYYKSSDEFQRLKGEVTKNAANPSNATDLAKGFRPAVVVDNPEALVIYKKSKGIMFYNKWVDRPVAVDLPTDMQTGRIAIVSDTGQITQIRQAAKQITVPLNAMRATHILTCREQH